MKSAKQETLELVQQMPENISLETIVAELLFKQRVRKGLEQLERGEVMGHLEVKEKLGRCLKSSGQ